MAELPAQLDINRWTYLVLTTRGVDIDVPGLPSLLESPAAYIGVIGSRRRWTTTRTQLSENGVARGAGSRPFPHGAGVERRDPRRDRRQHPGRNHHAPQRWERQRDVIPKVREIDMWQEYINATSIDEALSLLAERGEHARIVAGATDLILEIERGVRKGIETLIDITRIPDLDCVLLDEDEVIHLGPLVTHSHCVASKLIVERAFPLARQPGRWALRRSATAAPLPAT